MGTSPEAFNEVRNLLKKLDRSIDVARSRRLSEDTPEATSGTDTLSETDRPIGRARPIRRFEGDSFNSSNESNGARPSGNTAPRSGNF